MPISSPPSFSSVRTEFNTAGIGLASNFNSYRRGGSFITSNDIYYSGVGLGTSGSPLRLSQFAGLSGSRLATLSNHSCYTENQIPNSGANPSAVSTLSVNSNGILSLSGATSWSSSWSNSGSILIDGVEYWSNSLAGSQETVNVQSWLTGFLPGTFSVRGIIQYPASTDPDNNGTFRYGVYSTWEQLTSTRQYTVQASSVQINPVNFINLVLLLQFARTADTSTILGSCTITLFASADWTGGGGGGGGGGLEP